MHRVILGVDSSVEVDHRNGDGLDNRKSNLRPATRQQNCANVGKSSRNTSGYIGVTWNKKLRKWHAQIKVNRKNIHIGHYATKEEAARARAELARRIHGDFASRHEVVL